MPDVIEQLRAYGDAVESAVPEVEWAVPRNRHPLLLVAAVVVVLAGVASAVWVLQRSGENAEPPAVSTVPEVDDAVGWQALDPGPLAPREGAALVWTGDELVVWGGPREQSESDGYADGAAYDPETRSWRTMSPSPLRGGNAVGVWTGDEVLLWSVRTQADDRWAGAAWNPTTDAWRTLARPPQIDVDGRIQPVWTGRLMVDVAAGAVYDPATDSWGDLPARPVVGPVAATVWTGAEVLTLIQNRSDASYPTGYAVALAYDAEARTWQTLPPTGVGEIAVELAWDGEEAVALDYQMQAATYRPGDDRWRPLPDLPLRFSECGPSLARVDDTVVAMHCSGEAVLTEDSDWAIGTPPDDPVSELVSAGASVFGWWSSDESYNFPDAPVTYLQQFRSPPIDDLALAATIPVGTVQLDLPADAQLVDTHRTDDEATTTLFFDLDVDGNRCQLRSSYLGIVGYPTTSGIRETVADLDGVELRHISLPNGGLDRDRALVAVVPPGQLNVRAHALLAETDSDELDIACPDLATTERLLAGIHR